MEKNNSYIIEKGFFVSSKKIENSGKEMEKNCLVAAQLFKTLSNPLRLTILCALFQGEKTVGQIEKTTGGSQSQISQFLKRLEREKLVISKRLGKFVYYSIADKKIVLIFEALNKIFSKEYPVI